MSTIAGVAPMAPSSAGAVMMPVTPTASETASPSAIDCTAARAAPSGSFSPMRRATVAVAPMLNPMASAYRIVSIDSVRPTVATASAPSLLTKNTSHTANSDSISVSSTIGIASSSSERPTGPVV